MNQSQGSSGVLCECNLSFRMTQILDERGVVVPMMSMITVHFQRYSGPSTECNCYRN